MTERMMTTEEVAEYLNVSVRTVERWRYEGTGPRYSMIGKLARYRKCNVDRWFDARQERVTV